MVNKKLIEEYVGSKIVNIYDEARGKIFEFEDGQEWLVFPSYDEAYNACVNYVKELLAEEPETFEQWFLEDHFDVDAFMDDITPDIEDMVYEDIIDNPESYGLTEEDVQEENERFEEVLEETLNNRLDDIRSDPFEYLKQFGDDIYRRNLQLYLDIDEAAEDVVRLDGVAHFFATYDGEEVELDDGTVMYRVH